MYANHAYLTYAGQNEFYLVFGELGPQVGLNIENPPEAMEIRPVAKIAVSPPNMLRMAAAIRENVEKFRDKAQEEQRGR